MDYRSTDFKTELLAPKANLNEYVTESIEGKWEIVKRGKINHFFLSAFDIIYNRLSKVAATFEAPFFLNALLESSDTQLERLFADVDIIPYWSDVSHDTKARFLYNLFTHYSTITTNKGLTALIQYVFDNVHLSGEAVTIKDYPHTYDILIDITGTESFIPTEVFTARLIEFVNNIVPVTEKLRSLTYIENAKQIGVQAQTMTVDSAFTWSNVRVEPIELTVTSGTLAVTSGTLAVTQDGVTSVSNLQMFGTIPIDNTQSLTHIANEVE